MVCIYNRDQTTTKRKCTHSPSDFKVCNVYRCYFIDRRCVEDSLAEKKLFVIIRLFQRIPCQIVVLLNVSLSNCCTNFSELNVVSRFIFFGGKPCALAIYIFFPLGVLQKKIPSVYPHSVNGYSCFYLLQKGK